MKREIKFRVWDIDRKVWVKYLTYSIDDFSQSNKDWHKVMQYTGLKDKNGVEIYEGDINHNGDTLVYSNIHARFGWTDGGYLLHINSDYDEVIGNIYENNQK